MKYTLKPRYNHIIGKSYHFNNKSELINYIINNRSFWYVNTNNKTIKKLNKQLNDYIIE